MRVVDTTEQVPDHRKNFQSVKNGRRTPAAQRPDDSGSPNSSQMCRGVRLNTPVSLGGMWKVGWTTVRGNAIGAENVCYMS